MITKDQAIKLHVGQHIHYGECSQTVGKRGAIHTKIIAVKVNGAPKTWKTRPNEFSVPVKYGLYEYAYLTQDNADHFHLIEDCPLDKEI